MSNKLSTADMVVAGQTCTTSFPSRSPVLCTVTDTEKSSFVPMVDFDRAMSVLQFASVWAVFLDWQKQGLYSLVERRVAQAVSETPQWDWTVEYVLRGLC